MAEELASLHEKCKSRDAEVAELKATLDAIGRHSNKLNAEIAELAELKRLLAVALDAMERVFPQLTFVTDVRLFEKAIKQIKEAGK